ncbi:hypothetical protein X727_09965 [Mesorhizobium sp. L103C119B0]|nr:hypothetical protein X727_09965 [Mesorhizobium sp. L103C119B0]
MNSEQADIAVEEYGMMAMELGFVIKHLKTLPMPSYSKMNWTLGGITKTCCRSTSAGKSE